MLLDDSRVIPLHPVGAGRIGRFDGVVCLVGEDPTRVATAALFDACRNHRGDGASLIQKVAGILTRAAGATLPPFAIVAQDGEALLLAVHGSVTILAEQPGGPLRLGGGEVGTWATSRVLDAAYLSASVPGGALGAVPPLIDLQRGVAVADSFVVLPDGVSPGDLGAGDAGAVPAAHAEPAVPAAPVASAAPEPATPAAPPVGPVPPPDAPTPTPAPAPSPGAPRSDGPPAGPPPGGDEPSPRILAPSGTDDPADEVPPWVVPGGRAAWAAAAPDAAPGAPSGPVAPAAPAAPLPPPAEAPVPSPAPPAPVPAPAGKLGFASLAGGAFKIVELRPPATPPAGPPLPTAQQQVAAPAVDDETSDVHVVRVHGLHCGRGHFNDPRARYCAVCGLAMFQNSAVLVEGVRPPLGVLLLNNGESYPLTRNLVVGREPAGHPEVRNGNAEQLVPASKGPSLSRVHAQVRLDGWDVHLVDEASTNGTFVWDEARRQWIRLGPQQPYVLRPGDQLAFGELTATFETSLQQ